MTNKNQNQLFLDIQQQISGSQSKVDVIAEVLQIKKNAAYDRINGKKLLNFAELTSLCEAFHINLNDYLNPHSDKIEVSFPTLKTNVQSEKEFVEGLLSRLLVIQNLPKPEIWYISSEIPVLDYFRYPKLAFFKLYIYGKTVWELPYLKKEPFRGGQNYDASYLSIFQQINDIYTALPSTEIWSTHLVDNTLSQLKYFAQSGQFDRKADIFDILNNLLDLTNDLESSAESGQKFYKNGESGGTFNLFHNEITHTNNVVLINSLAQKMVFATFDNPNYFQSNSEALWQYTANWFTKLKKRAQPVSQQSEKDRLMLFNLCRNKIIKTSQFIERLDLKQ
jgi:hypothetical protein